MRGRSSNLCSLLLFSAFSLLLGAALVSGIRICSYNVNRFNSAKAAKYNVLHTLTKIISKCDICLLQDVVDPDGKAVKPLVASLNRWKSTRYDKQPYASVSSKGLGKSADNMQQYVFIYRRDIVNVTGQHQYEGDAFVRPPFAVCFYSNKTDIKEFILVPLHSEPEQAVQEIDSLYDVFEKVSEMWNNTNVMFLGDFHAGCAYVTRQDKKLIRLYTNSNFSWLIGDGVDTTVTDQTDCAYDRIVVHGQDFLKAIMPFSGKVFNFGKEFKLRRSKVLEVSDHYPIEVRLKGSAFLLLAPPLLILLGVSAIVQFFLPAL